MKARDLVQVSVGSALHIAAEKGHTAIVRVLVEADANVNLMTSGGRTALHIAAENEHTVCGAVPLPQSGQYYFEVIFSHRPIGNKSSLAFFSENSGVGVWGGARNNCTQGLPN